MTEVYLVPHLRGIPKRFWESSKQRSHTELSVALHNPSAQSYPLSVHPLLPRKTGWPVEAEGGPGQHELRVELVEKQFVAKNCAVFCEELGSPGTLSNMCVSIFQS